MAGENEPYDPDQDPTYSLDVLEAPAPAPAASTPAPESFTTKRDPAFYDQVLQQADETAHDAKQALYPEYDEISAPGGKRRDVSPVRTAGESFLDSRLGGIPTYVDAAGRMVFQGDDWETALAFEEAERRSVEEANPKTAIAAKGLGYVGNPTKIPGAAKGALDIARRNPVSPLRYAAGPKVAKASKIRVARTNQAVASKKKADQLKAAARRAQVDEAAKVAKSPGGPGPIKRQMKPGRSAEKKSAKELKALASQQKDRAKTAADRLEQVGGPEMSALKKSGRYALDANTTAIQSRARKVRGLMTTINSLRGPAARKLDDIIMRKGGPKYAKLADLTVGSAARGSSQAYRNSVLNEAMNDPEVAPAIEEYLASLDNNKQPSDAEKARRKAELEVIRRAAGTGKRF